MEIIDLSDMQHEPYELYCIASCVFYICFFGYIYKQRLEVQMK